MTTYTEFYNNLKSLSVSNIKTLYDTEPDKLDVNDLPAIAELDMNPVIVTPDKRDCRVVDARIRVEGDDRDQ